MCYCTACHIQLQSTTDLYNESVQLSNTMYVHHYTIHVHICLPCRGKLASTNPGIWLCIHLLCTHRKKISVFGTKQSTSTGGKEAMTSGTSFLTSKLVLQCVLCQFHTLLLFMFFFFSFGEGKGKLCFAKC
jgi:hypothetical protein